MNEIPTCKLASLGGSIDHIPIYMYDCPNVLLQVSSTGPFKLYIQESTILTAVFVISEYKKSQNK